MTAEPATRSEQRRRRQLAPRYRGDIEGLRAVAVLLVVAFHAGGSLVVSGGFVGVDVFFVLSGFLITGLLVDELRRTGSISLIGFYARRVRRLMPLAALVLVSTVIATYLLVPPIDRGGVGTDVLGAALGVANWNFALQSTQYMADTAKSPVLHFWSLGVEEQFYLVWPLLLLLVAGRQLARRRGLSQRGLSQRAAGRRVVLILCLLGSASFATSWWVGGDGTFAYYGLHTRAWELAVGAGLALGRPLLPRLPRWAAVLGGYVGLAMVLLAAMIMDTSTPFPGTAAAVPVLGTAMLIAAGSRMYVAGVPRILQAAPLRYVGRISYAWYLWHWPCLVLVRQAAPGLGKLGTVAVVALSFGLSAVSHRLVERPMRTATWLATSGPRSLRLGVGLVAASTLAACSLWLPAVQAAQGQVATGVGLDMAADGVGASDAVYAPSTGKPKPSKASEPAAATKPMTPAQARADEPPAPHGCYTGYARTSPPQIGLCRFGDPHGTRTIALIGDSHAAQWFPAFLAAAEQNHWTLYYLAKSECAMADVTQYVSKSKGPYVACASWRHDMLRELATVQDLDAVFIGRWHNHQTHVLQDGRRLAPEAAGPVWRQGMQRTLDALPDVGKVVVLRDTPRPGQDVPACLSEHLHDPGKCAFPRDGHTHLDDVLTRAEQAAGGSRLTELDFTELICPGRRCEVVTTTGLIVYRDDHHLTATFSRSITTRVAAAINGLLG